MQPPADCEENRNAGHLLAEKRFSAIFRDFPRFSAVFKAFRNFSMGFPADCLPGTPKPGSAAGWRGSEAAPPHLRALLARLKGGCVHILYII